MKKLGICLVALCANLFLSLSAVAQEPPGVSREALARFIQEKSDLKAEEAARLVEQIAQQFNASPGSYLPIQGALYTSGLNGALFVDTDTWLMDVAVLGPNGQFVDVPELFAAKFENGGLKFELAYKWMFTFIPTSASNIRSLNGAVYGRGLGITLENFVGLEGAWMPGENRSGSLFHLAIKLGWGAGIQFPKMTLYLRHIYGQ
jgi:hypothetical protein